MDDIVTIICDKLIEEQGTRIEEDPEMQQLLEESYQSGRAVAELLGGQERLVDDLNDAENACRARYGKLMFRAGMSACVRLFLELI